MALERLYTRQELTELGIGSKAHIYALTRKGELHPIRLGRFLKFKESDVKAYIERETKKGLFTDPFKETAPTRQHLRNK